MGSVLFRGTIFIRETIFKRFTRKSGQEFGTEFEENHRCRSCRNSLFRNIPLSAAAVSPSNSQLYPDASRWQNVRTVQPHFRQVWSGMLENRLRCERKVISGRGRIVMSCGSSEKSLTCALRIPGRLYPGTRIWRRPEDFLEERRGKVNKN